MLFKLPSTLRKFNCPVNGCDWYGSALEYLAHRSYWMTCEGHRLSNPESSFEQADEAHYRRTQSFLNLAFNEASDPDCRSRRLSSD